MKDDFATVMRRALEKTSAGDPGGATALLQDALSAHSHSRKTGTRDPGAAPGKPRGRLGKLIGGGARNRTGLPSFPDLKTTLPHLGAPLLSAKGKATRASVPDGARVETRHRQSTAGDRDYRLFVPSDRPDPPKGVLVMLHGCTQDPDDFATGTRMDHAAETAHFVVAYPRQTGRHNAQSCWNWFRPEDQARTGGEAELLAGLGCDLAAEFGCGGRVFAAGLSAGGAMAAILGETHPDVFTGVGVHSGLPARAASDVVSAFAAMKGETRSGAQATGPAIVFHGTADRTVVPENADAILPGSGLEHRESGNGRSWSRLVMANGSELWRVDGAGHAWLGGSPAGSFADPTGPDASAEMLRFFSGLADDPDKNGTPAR